VVYAAKGGIPDGAVAKERLHCLYAYAAASRIAHWGEVAARVQVG